MTDSDELTGLTAQYERGELDTTQYRAALKLLYPKANVYVQVLIRRRLKKLEAAA